MPRRRTFATDILSFAHSMLTALRHPACAGQQRRLSGHGQPLTDAAERIEARSAIDGMGWDGLRPLHKTASQDAKRSTSDLRSPSDWLSTGIRLSWRQDAMFRVNTAHGQPLTASSVFGGRRGFGCWPRRWPRGRRGGPAAHRTASRRGPASSAHRWRSRSSRLLFSQRPRECR